jgi:hypothetical protein
VAIGLQMLASILSGVLPHSARWRDIALAHLHLIVAEASATAARSPAMPSRSRAYDARALRTDHQRPGVRVRGELAVGGRAGTSSRRFAGRHARETSRARTSAKAPTSMATVGRLVRRRAERSYSRAGSSRMTDDDAWRVRMCDTSSVCRTVRPTWPKLAQATL